MIWQKKGEKLALLPGAILLRGCAVFQITFYIYHIHD